MARPQSLPRFGARRQVVRATPVLPAPSGAVSAASPPRSAGPNRRALFWTASVLLHAAALFFALVDLPGRDLPPAPAEEGVDVVFEGGTASSQLPAPSAMPDAPPTPPDLPALPGAPSAPPALAGAPPAPPLALPPVDMPFAPPPPLVERPEAPTRPGPPPVGIAEAPPRFDPPPPLPAPPLAPQPPRDLAAAPPPPPVEARPPAPADLPASPRVAAAPPVAPPVTPTPRVDAPSALAPAVPPRPPRLAEALPPPRPAEAPRAPAEPPPAPPREAAPREAERQQTAALSIPPPPRPAPPEPRAAAPRPPAPQPRPAPRPADPFAGVLDLSGAPVALGGVPAPAARGTDRRTDPPNPSGRYSTDATFTVRGAELGEGWRRAMIRVLQSRMYYPRDAAMNGEDGTAILRFTVTRDGRVQDLRLVGPTGSRPLDIAAQAVRARRATAALPPGTRGDTAEITLNARYVLIGR
ncbi:TonB family protein [Roseomonas sp. CCTCC AB2023176]|uniref:TonB family protein n=1 Tax=Roseomonas sp. CCTCC AB2023176 TaxID=3342640 RepID=UPI0035D773A1